ncbi:MAG: hypothetical protein C0183_17275 [Roseiflexus castenholzii]|nr:MAG: hypothetical protein C0183_17275 [Roseiflexus castenholzii]
MRSALRAARAMERKAGAQQAAPGTGMVGQAQIASRKAGATGRGTEAGQRKGWEHAQHQGVDAPPLARHCST